MFELGVPVDLFPRGIGHYLVGGLLIGLGTVIVYVGTGIHAGASTFLESTLSYGSSLSRFQQPRFVRSRDWRVVFTLGIVAGAFAFAIAAGEFAWTTAVDPWRLFLGGTLVGVGTRLGKGCTSGHGVCGVGSGSPVSILNVVVFVAVAVGVAHIAFALGVRP
mgnify:CR=1 FL=1